VIIRTIPNPKWPVRPFPLEIIPPGELLRGDPFKIFPGGTCGKKLPTENSC